MEEQDRLATKRICDIVAVAVNDIDSVTVAVEDGIAYLEGVVPSEEQRQAIVRAVRQVDGLHRVISCLAAEHAMPRPRSAVHAAGGGPARADALLQLLQPELTCTTIQEEPNSSEDYRVGLFGARL